LDLRALTTVKWDCERCEELDIRTYEGKSRHLQPGRCPNGLCRPDRRFSLTASTVVHTLTTNAFARSGCRLLDSERAAMLTRMQDCENRSHCYLPPYLRIYLASFVIYFSLKLSVCACSI